MNDLTVKMERLVGDDGGAAEKPTPTAAQVAEMDVAALKAALKAAGQPVGGKKTELRRRLEVALFGSEERFSPGRTRCKRCGAPLRVRSTRRYPDLGEAGLVERRVRCQGKKPHSYSIWEADGRAV